MAFLFFNSKRDDAFWLKRKDPAPLHPLQENAPEKEPGRKKVIHDAINPKFDKSVKCQGPLFLEFNSKIKLGEQLI